MERVLPRQVARSTLRTAPAVGGYSHVSTNRVCDLAVISLPRDRRIGIGPGRFRRELARRAKVRGETLTQDLQGVLEREVARPLSEEVFARIRGRASVTTKRPLADVIGEERKRRSVA